MARTPLPPFLYRAVAIAALAAAAAGCQSETGPGADARQLLDNLTGNSALVNAQRMENAADANDRVQGILYLVSFEYGKLPPFTTRYQEIAAQDADPVVRSTAIRALNRARDESATGVFVRALSDKSELVQIEAAKALGNMPDDSAIEPLLELAALPPGGGPGNQDVRVAAVQALRHYRRIEVARLLAGLLNDPSFGVSWEANNGLRQLTGVDLRFDESAWLAFLSGPDKPLG